MLKAFVQKNYLKTISGFKQVKSISPSFLQLNTNTNNKFTIHNQFNFKLFRNFCNDESHSDFQKQVRFSHQNDDAIKDQIHFWVTQNPIFQFMKGVPNQCQLMNSII